MSRLADGAARERSRLTLSGASKDLVRFRGVCANRPDDGRWVGYVCDVPRVAALLAAYDDAESLEEAETALDKLSALGLPSDLRLGDLYDGLAEVAAEDGDFSLAVRTQRSAIELGCDHREIAKQMLGWYLLKDGKKEEGEAAFAELAITRGDDPELLTTLANARMDSGDSEGAAEAFDAALAAATRLGDADWISQIREERRYVRSELGLTPDESDRLAGLVEQVESDAPTRWSLAWFPRDQIEAALSRWPSLADDLSDPDAYCQSIEVTLRQMSADTGRRPTIAALDVERLTDYADAQRLDADSGAARSRFAAELGRHDEVVSWPPGRNDPCWCGSGRKYKRCCG
jgi:uncharacterized protein YecA (UPF0149 family)/predicted RNase H-like HicB family nuclease